MTSLDLFPFIHALDEALRAEMDRAVRPVHLEPGALICLEGDRCQAIPLVVSGEARVYRTSPEGRVITLYRIEPGESCILTASCLLSDRPFPAFAEAETPVEALLLPADVFVRLFAEAAPLREHVFSLLARRLGDVIELVDAVAFRRVDERLARHLLDQADAAGRVARTHEALAEALGTSREVVSRTLKEFERQGLVALSRGAVSVVDAEPLRRYGVV
ncbi:MAG: Crp/Fnr family transcriptional regulator [Sandaracinaceae bacterium]